MIILDYRDRRPLYEQIVERFQELIMNGALPADSQLPSVRNLAVDLSINPNTIQRAYGELERLGFIYSVKGKGSFVSETSELVELKEKEFWQELLSLIKKAVSLGIPEERVMDYCHGIYRGDMA